MNPKIQKVVFRKFNKREGGEIIALFCSTSRECLPGNVMSYMHHGQHSQASKNMGRWIRLASPVEYAPLLAELQQIYALDCKIVPVSRLIP
jgi:hypothetical protein